MKQTTLRSRIALVLAPLAVTAVVQTAVAAPASAHGWGYYCGHVNALHRAMPDVYFIGHRDRKHAGEYGHWHVYVHDPLIGNSSTLTRKCS